MKTTALKALAAASLSLVALAPVAAQESRTVVSYADLDLTSAAGAETLNARLLGAIDAVCERPSVLDIKGNAVWEGCRDEAMSQALKQLNAKGAFHRPSVTVE